MSTPSVATYLATAHRCLKLVSHAPDRDDFQLYDAIRACDAIAGALSDLKTDLAWAEASTIVLLTFRFAWDRRG